MSGRELLGRAHVDEHDIAAAEALDQLLAADRLDLFAEVVAGCPFDLRQTGRRGVSEGEPEREHIFPGQRVAHPGALALTGHYPRSVQALQVLRGIGARLAAGPRKFLDAPRPLSKQVEQLQPAWAGKRLAHYGDRVEQHAFRLTGLHVAIQ